MRAPTVPLALGDGLMVLTIGYTYGCGDANSDTQANVGDAVFVINHSSKTAWRRVRSVSEDIIHSWEHKERLIVGR